MNRFALLFPSVLLLAVAGTQAQTVPAAGDTTADTAGTSANSLPVLQPVPGDGRQGTVKTVQGDVTLVHGQTRYAAVAYGAVRQGDQIAVGANSNAAFTLRDGTVVSVGPDSVVALSQYRFEPTTEKGNIALSLLKGSLRVVTGLITHAVPETEPAKVKVITPTAVIGVRGTDAIVDVNS